MTGLFWTLYICQSFAHLYVKHLSLCPRSLFLLPLLSILFLSTLVAETGSHCTTQSGLKGTIFLPWPPMCWDCRCALSCLIQLKPSLPISHDWSSKLFLIISTRQPCSSFIPLIPSFNSQSSLRVDEMSQEIFHHMSSETGGRPMWLHLLQVDFFQSNSKILIVVRTHNIKFTTWTTAPV